MSFLRVDVWNASWTGESGYKEHYIVGDVVTCNFKYARELSLVTPDEGFVDEPQDAAIVFGEASIYTREPIKTADVPGFCENQRIIELSGDSFFMNEAGKTISTLKIPRIVDSIYDEFGTRNISGTRNLFQKVMQEIRVLGYPPCWPNVSLRDFGDWARDSDRFVAFPPPRRPVPAPPAPQVAGQ